jgi:hypothetical protein
MSARTYAGRSAREAAGPFVHQDTATQSTRESGPKGRA